MRSSTLCAENTAPARASARSERASHLGTGSVAGGALGCRRSEGRQRAMKRACRRTLSQRASHADVGIGPSVVATKCCHAAPPGRCARTPGSVRAPECQEPEARSCSWRGGLVTAHAPAMLSAPLSRRIMAPRDTPRRARSATVAHSAFGAGIGARRVTHRHRAALRARATRRTRRARSALSRRAD